MIELANVFSVSPVYAIVSVAIAGVIGFIAGYLLRSAIIAQYEKRIKDLEKEMLSNHARILELEKQITDLKREKLIMKDKEPAMPKT